MDFLSRIKTLAKQKPKRILFAEGKEPRVLAAAEILKKEGFADPILLGDPEKEAHFEEYIKQYAELRKVDLETARQQVSKPETYATLWLLNGEVDGMISGPTSVAKDRILPALQLIKTKEAFHKVSGVFFMQLDEDTDPDAANGGVLLFADCAVIVDPTAEELAEIAIDSAETARHFGIDPKIAMLSFSSAGSSKNEHVDKVRQATALVRERRPDLPVEGEIQVDAALMDEVGKRKIPGSKIAGHANVLIFPDLEAGNIGYKLVERLAGAKAIGPILQGLKKPVNELSRGSNVDDIVNLAALMSAM